MAPGRPQDATGTDAQVKDGWRQRALAAEAQVERLMEALNTIEGVHGHASEEEADECEVCFVAREALASEGSSDE